MDLQQNASVEHPSVFAALCSCFCMNALLLSDIQAIVLGLKVSQWEVQEHVPLYSNPAGG